MLTYIIGNIDVPAAAVALAFLGMCTILGVTYMSRKSKADYDLEKAKIASDFEYKKLTLDQRLITSHKSNDH